MSIQQLTTFRTYLSFLFYIFSNLSNENIKAYNNHRNDGFKRFVNLVSSLYLEHCANSLQIEIKRYAYT